MRKQIYCLLSFLWISCLSVSAADRWAINSAGGITWQVDERVPHEDHIEMSGLRVSTVLRYGVDANGAFMLNRSMVWPMLRTIPNNTHASLMRRFAWNVTDMVEVNGQSLLNEEVKEVTLNGTMVVQSEYTLPRKGKLGLTRILFPSVSNPAFCEKYILRNIGESAISVEIPSSRSVVETDAAKGVDGSYKLVSTINGQVARQLQPGEELTFSATFAGYKKDERELSFDIDRELQARQDLIAGFWDNLVLDTPDPVINTMFAFAKIRGAESIYDTKGGLMHGPGGESYYAAIWANDQAEYINPFFPYLGYEVGNRSALCSYEHFARFMNPEYKPLPSSIIAEGIDVWAGAGDRGDAAMVAYGASRYALSKGDKAEAEKLWPLIEWCLEYCRRNLNESGVVASDADELENRFPAGKANLCTSSLYYDALISAGYLGKDLGKPVAAYARQATALKKNTMAKKIKFEQGYNRPAPRDYVGQTPLSVPESTAMFDFTRNHDFSLILAYHTQGEVIYWKYLDEEPEGARRIAEYFAKVSGYRIEETPAASGYAGYKDWFINFYDRPGYTIEAGLGENPLPMGQFSKIYKDNVGILLGGMTELE